VHIVVDFPEGEVRNVAISRVMAPHAVCEEDSGMDREPGQCRAVFESAFKPLTISEGANVGRRHNRRTRRFDVDGDFAAGHEPCQDGWAEN
jgi:hypothetical protein